MTTTPSEAAGHRPMRVLFVEDNPDVREVVALLLQEQALDVLTCDSAESAEAAFSAGHFDVLLTDVSLPAMSGCFGSIRSDSRCQTCSSARTSSC